MALVYGLYDMGRSTDTRIEKKTRKPGSGGARTGAGVKSANPKPYTIRVSADEKKLILDLRKAQN